MTGLVAGRVARSLLALLVGLGALGLVPVADAAQRSPERVETWSLASPLVDTPGPGGRLEKGRTEPRVHVRLPAGYDDHPDRRYPVLWLLHGANGGTDTWIRGTLRFLTGLPAIVVMPDGGLFGMYTDWWNGGARGGPAWATYHLQVLRQEVEDRYRIRPERRWHAIAGISMGGQGALRYAAMLPGYFGSVVGMSAAMPDTQSLELQGGLGLLGVAGATYGADYQQIWGPPTGAYAAGNNPRVLVPNYEHTRMYLTSGWGIHCPQDPINPSGIALDTVTEAVLHGQQAPFAQAARAEGADVTWVTTCGSHTFGVWDRAMPAARAWGFFEEVAEDPDSWTYRTIATSGEVWGLTFRFEEPPSTVAELRRSGTVLRAAGDGRLHLGGPGGCRLDADLPFERELPPACR